MSSKESNNHNNDKVTSGRQAYRVNLASQHLPHSGSDITTKSFYIKTFGWPMDAVLYDFCAVFNQD